MNCPAYIQRTSDLQVQIERKKNHFSCQRALAILKLHLGEGELHFEIKNQYFV